MKPFIDKRVCRKPALGLDLPRLLVAGLVALLSASAQAAGGPPDILGIRLGMTPQQAFDLLKQIDPAHVAAADQMTIPELYGDRPVTFGLTTTTTGTNDQIFVNLTLPPAPQQVWQVRRTLSNFSVTADNLLASLQQKYGNEPFHSGLGGPTEIDWFFDQQWRPVNPTDPAGSFALKNCMGQQLNPMSVTPTAVVGSATPVVHSVPHTAPIQIPPVFDPDTPSKCQGLVWVHAIASPGTYASLDVTISDFTLQHVAAKTYANAVNAVVTQQQQKADRALQQQAAPRL